MISSSFQTFTKAVGCGHTLAYGQQEESVARQGKDTKGTASWQFDHVNSVLEIVSEALKTLAKPAIPTSIKVVSLLTPVVLAYGVEQEIVNPLLRKVVCTAHKHVIWVANVVALVSLAVLFSQGHYLFAATLVGWVGVASLVQAQILPDKVRRVTFRAANIMGSTAGVLTGNWIIKIVSFLCLLPEIADIYQHFYPRPQISERTIESEVKEVHAQVSYEDLATLDYELDVRHLNEQVLPPIPPDVNPMEKMLELFKKINWEDPENKDILAVRLAMDRRWTKREDATTEGVEYLHTELTKLLKGIMKEEVEVDPPSPAGYKRLQMYLRYITHRLETASQKQRTDVLTVLAISGGNYCGTKEDKVITDLFFSLLTEEKSLTLRDKFLLILQLARQHQFDNFLQANKTRFWYIGILSDWEDIHYRNKFATMFQGCGLPDDGVKDDCDRSQSKAEQAFWSIVGRGLRFQFFEKYESTAIDSVIEVIGSSTISKQDIYDWWRDGWLKRPGNEGYHGLANNPPKIGAYRFEEYKGFISFEDERPKLFKGDKPKQKPVQRYKLTISPRIITAMLLEMRIFKRKG